MNQQAKSDVVIIGMGAAGGTASYVLTKAGLNVVGLEAGPRLSYKDFDRQLDEIGGSSFRNQMGEPKFNHEVPTWRPDAKAATQPTPAPILMMNAVGGTSIHYGTQSWRYRTDDFKMRSTTVQKYGEKALPEGNAIADWPVTYEDIEPYYDKVEYLIGVSGKAGNVQGKKVSGGNPFESPRQRDYPLPPLRSMGYADIAAKAMQDQGYHPFPQPAAIISQDYDNRPACSYCGFCGSYGCWNNAKSSTLVSAIPAAEQTGKLEIRPNSRVLKILSDKGGHVTGVQYLDESGNLVEQPAGMVILSTYVYENTRLLLLSTGDAYANGLSNNHGQVGQHYLSHVYVTVNGLFPGKALNLYSGTTGQATAMDDLNGDNFDHTDLGFIRGAVIFASNGELPVAASRTIPSDIPGWGTAYKKWIHENGNSVGSLFAQLEDLAYDANFLDLDPDKKDPLGVPIIRVTYNLYDNEQKAGQFLAGKLADMLKAMGASTTWGGGVAPLPVNSHAYGGTRIGDDPATSVVDKHFISHEAANLAILGGSCFPGTTGYNPTETIEATSWYAADYIAQNFDKIAV